MPLREQHHTNAPPPPLPAHDQIFGPILKGKPDRAFIVAQLGQSLDGRVATKTGDSRWINAGSALDHLHRLRANVDAVIVGINTVLADDPLLTVRRLEGRNPVRVIIDPHGKLEASAAILNDDGVPVLVIRGNDLPAPERCEVLRVPMKNDRFEPKAIAKALYERGLEKIMVEGGAATVSAFIDAGIVDRLHLLVAPIILGSGKSGLTLKSIDTLAEAARPVTAVHILDDGDVLFDCELISDP